MMNKLRNPAGNFFRRVKTKIYNEHFNERPLQLSVCNASFFLSFASGQCVFGNNCRFSHMSERDMENLRMQIEGELFPQDGTVCHGHGPHIESVNLWAMLLLLSHLAR
jgi:hypothetical protein